MKRALVAAGGLAGAWLIMLGGTLGLSALGATLLNAWGVTAENVGRAPSWVRLVALHYGEISSIVTNGLLALYAVALTRLSVGRCLRWGRGAGKGALAGLLSAAALTLAMRAADAVRFGWSLAQPAWSWDLPLALVLYGAGALSAAALFRGWLMALCGSGVAACALSAAAFALMTSASFAPVALVCSLFLGFLLALLHRKSGGIGADAAAQGAFFSVLYAVMGFSASGTNALYETYPSGADWLSGGAAGPMNSPITLALLGAACVLLVLYDKKRFGREKNDGRL